MQEHLGENRQKQQSHHTLFPLSGRHILEHHFAKVGHRFAPYDPTLTPSHTPLTPGTRKRLPQRGFVQVGFEETSSKPRNA
jgi:hypothetical protein